MIIGISKSFGSLDFIFLMISLISFSSQISILFKMIIIFFPLLIKELIFVTSFLLRSPATVNKISSELFISEYILSAEQGLQKSKPGESSNSIVLS